MFRPLKSNDHPDPAGYTVESPLRMGQLRVAPPTQNGGSPSAHFPSCSAVRGRWTPRRTQQQPTRGFTLIELMTTVAIAMILMTLAVPNFSAVIMNNALAVQATDFTAALALARSQANTRRRTVMVCKSANASNCATSDEVQWEDGWIIYVDEDGSRTKQDDELVLRTSDGLGGDNTLRSDDVFADFIAFVADGRSIGSGSAQPPTEGQFRLCDARGAEKISVIDISPIGRARVFQPTGAEEDACP